MRLTDEDGLVVAVNKMFCKIVGKPEEELVGQPFTTIYSKQENHEKLARTYRRRFERDDFSAFMEKKLTLWTGKAVILEVQSSFVQTEEGRKLLLSIFRDVTDRSEAQEALRLSEKTLRNVYENVKDVIFTINRDGVITSINKEFERKTGWSAQEWIGKDFHPLLHPDDVRQAWYSFRSSIRSKSSLSVELRVRTRDGEYLTGEFTWSAMFENGKLVSVLGAVRDITERKRIEAALRESENNYRNMFAYAVQPMFQSTVEGKLLNANKALMKLLGYESFLEMAELNLRDLYVNPEQRNQIQQIAEARGYLSNVELQLKRKNGKIITVIEYSRTLQDENGRIIGYEGILEDVTARKAMEQKIAQYVSALENSQKALAKMNSEKDKLLSILSHDLRSPFSSVLGFCDILLTEHHQLSDEERVQFLTYIKEASKDQLALVNKLLDWSRLETGRIRMEIKDVDLKHIVDRAIMSLYGISKKKNISVSSRLKTEVPIRGDEHLLQDAIENLIANSLKFTPEKGSVEVGLVSQTANEVTISVSDTGIGIPAADLPKLFKVKEKYTRKGLGGEKGTGLGLPVVAEIVQKHAGTIRVESEENKGTTFYLTFPTHKPKEGMNILIVDDEEGVRVLHTRYLRRFYPDAHFLYAGNGMEGFETAQKYHPQIIVTDYAMPVMDGFEMLTRLRKDPATQPIPVIVITGEDSKMSREAMALTGAMKILLKPVTPEQLGEAVTQVMPDRQ
jgi:PAS domain S-box-containing protein